MKSDQSVNGLSNKHAYLIMAHNNFRILEKLLVLLDDERNDIYLHVDKTAGEFPKDVLKNSVKKASLIFVPRILVNWGGYSQIQAELLLLKESTKCHHAYYHLISGVDLPIKTQMEIHEFFDKNQGKEFFEIDHNITANEIHDRVRYYRPLQNKIGRNTGSKIVIYKKLERLILKIQRVLHVDRTKKVAKPFYKGANWFSITHELAEYVVSKEKDIRKTYRNTICADEVFLQTLAKNSEYATNIVEDYLRLIDWDRGVPYTFTLEDFDMILSSDCLFARKFDEAVDMEIVNKIYDMLCEGCQ